MNCIDLLTEQFESVRRYTNMTLDGVEYQSWFHVPAGSPTHIAWQLGHMAVGAYGLGLAIPRGKRPEDEELISESFLKHFGRGSTPNPNIAENPGPQEIQATYDRVHDQLLKEIPLYSEQLLAEASPIKHPMFQTKFGSLMWCIQHEYTHAGQLSLIYRLLGGEPRF